jgi:hypothetical protein
MPRLVPLRLVATCALALISILLLTASAVAKGPVADLRVIGKGGKALAEVPIGLAGQVSVKASPKATCFGPGTGGSGGKTMLKGNSALGMLARAARFTDSLEPLLVTDHFIDEFGLGICGVGATKATKTKSWFVKLNHKTQVVGGESVKVHGGDEVLWAYGGYPYPEELALSAPSEAQANVPFTVQVFSYDEKGKKKPASGATVTGASGPTDSAGRATVTLAAPTELVATGKGDIPSPPQVVCLGGGCSQASGIEF